MLIGRVFLLFASLVALFVSYFLLNNIDIVSGVLRKVNKFISF